jgi:lipopolysaccharide transport system ATP-binding protein
MVAAIRVEGLSKCYRIREGRRGPGYRTLRESLTELALRPVRAWTKGGKAAASAKFWALNDVSFEVQPGEVVGIIGRNGAGKSTLLKIVSNITKPTTGLVELRGRVGSLLEVGTGFHPELTGSENIYLNGAILGMSSREIRRKFDEIVDFSGVEKFLDTPVKRYSSGMYVRLAFAVAAHLEPEILLVDEVLAVGDAAFQKKCLGKMGQVAKEGRTVLFVSHDLGSVTRLCGRGILLDAGRVEYAGDIASVVARYLPDQLLSNNGFADLSDRGDRSGTGHARFRSVELLTDGQPCSTIPFGNALRIKLEIEVHRPFDPAPPAIIIATADGLPVHDLWGDDCSWSGEVGRHSFTATVPRVHLYPGTYAIDLWMGEQGLDRVDYIRNAISFEVVQTPDSGLDRPLRRGNGLVFQPSMWAYAGEPTLRPAQGLAGGGN